MKVTGSCHCGEIAFEAEVDPGSLRVCHCADCQKLTGSAFRSNIAAPSFRLIRGKPTTYIKTADSGARRAHAFCPTCGSPIYATDPVTPKRYSLRIGTLDQRHTLGAPTQQIWCKSALPWARLDEVTSHDRQ